MAQHVMPTIPYIIFGYVEPIILACACFVALKYPHQYLRSLGPTPDTYQPDDASLAAILSLGNVFLLAGLAQFLCCNVSKEVHIARSFIYLLVLADWGHLWATYMGIGYDIFINPRLWNTAAAVNIGGAVAMNIIRFAYLFGFFGKDNENLLKEDVVKKVK
ncbi:hypothetical protein TWF481_011907 [Arthrobotrys musiformis]|uniref:DUF7704 domain-containing protein n=1 Tax=Arthrobotrys musiformis TaxID=47236 RepID=A0AAV9VXW7_9PEZI